MRRVVVTGMALASPLGSSVNDAYSRLMRLKNCIEYEPAYEVYQHLNAKLCSKVRDFVVPEHFNRKVTRTMGRVALMSTVVTEGLILGKAIVTTQCSGMKELLGDSEYGIVTENSERGLYYGVKKFLDAPGTIYDMSKRAKLRGKMLRKETAVGETEKFFIQLISNKTGIRYY